MRKKILAGLLGLSVTLQSGSISAMALTNTSSEQIDKQISVSEEKQMNSCSEKPLHLTCTNEEENEYKHGSVIKKEFKIESLYDVDNYEIKLSSYDGVEIIKEPTYKLNEKEEPTVEIAFRILDNCEIGTVSFMMYSSVENNKEKSNQIYTEKNIYCYHDSEYDYVSTVYLDCLADYSLKLKNYLNDIDRSGEKIEVEKKYADSPKGLSASSNYSHSVSGYISWTDIAGGVHAAENIKVELYSVNGTAESYIGSTYTSSAGGYSISFSSTNYTQNVKFKVLSEGTNVTVKNASSPYSTYVYESSTFEVQNFTRASYTASNTTNIGQSLSIQQAMALANNYIYSLESYYLPNINVAFPDINGTRYSSSANKIYIEDHDEFDWDVAQHEYGHYVEHYFNISNSPGGSHSFSDNLADNSNKDRGIRLAWGEGWATYFALNLQKEMSASSLYIPNVGDTLYQDVYPSYTYSLDLENLPSSYWLGEANEATVCAVLYDMTDGYNSSEGDNIWLANNNVWDITKSSHCKTLSEFITAFYASGFSNSTRLSLGSTLSRYKVAASPYAVSSNNPPTFSWNAQGGSNSYPNNQFRVVFLNSSYNTILTTGYTTSNSIQLTASQWNLIQNTHSTVYYYIETKQTDTTAPTGPYYSIMSNL